MAVAPVALRNKASIDMWLRMLMRRSVAVRQDVLSALAFTFEATALSDIALSFLTFDL